MFRFLSLFFTLISATFCSVATCAVTLDKSLHYSARYHLGFINIEAGYADIDIHIDGENLSGTFDGQSIPWRGRVYCINDTLQARMTPCMESVTYENGWYTKPRRKQLDNRSFCRQLSKNYKTINGQGSLNASRGTMEAVTITADLIGLFYYLQTIDFDNMAEGDSRTIPISMPGGKSGELFIKYFGKDDYCDNRCYHITFTYSYNGQLSKYPVKCIVSRDQRIPLLFSADIKIGHVELVLTDA